MLINKMSAGTNAEQSTTAGVLNVSQTIAKPHVVRSLITVFDLRIGNYVFGVDEYQGTALPICSLHSDNTLRLLIGKESVGCFSANLINPIELDESWMDFFGFKRHGEWYIFQNFPHSINVSFVHNKVTIGTNEEYEVDVKYVHQLQNLYFALTGSHLQPVE